MSKDRQIVRAVEKGSFLKPCPGTPGMLCCNLFVLNPVVGCPYDCAYCFLQAYQSDPHITVYTNAEEMIEEVRELKARFPGKELRICTGELADSLALESLSPMAVYLVEQFRRIEGVLLELKTKSTAVEPLLSLDHGGRTVVSWSLNPAPLAERLERGCPGPTARIAAAKRTAEAGYPLAFHFDPLIRHEGWKRAYERLVDELFEAVPAESIRWISLGGFRYTPAMKERIEARFPRSGLFLEEFLPCPDGKYRYFAGHRIAMYRALWQRIRERGGAAVPVYLCMEAPFVWRQVFGGLPEEGCAAPLFDKKG